MDRFEASLRETQETLQALQRTRAKGRAVLDRLCEHLMGLWTLKIMASTAPVSAEAKGALWREGVLMPMGAQA
jgi:hypothetical protein